jgi:hypothetical protein
MSLRALACACGCLTTRRFQRVFQRYFQIHNLNAARLTRAAILFDIGKLS